ncbi:MAG: hypothetical protein QOD03_537 [Verrucomicrobiota bacterium]|jgi:glycerol-3-phosphate acyltransferase PlsY
MSWFNNLHSTNWTQASSIAVCAYLLGCFTTGYYLVRLWLHEDVRELGSGNVGARNVGRILGKRGFFFTLLFDFGKGALAVWTTRHFTSDDHIVAFAMIAVVAGHIWPVQLRFRGGKGMATAVGALLVFDPWLALTFTIAFLCLVAIFRRTVLPGLIALACVPLGCLWLDHNPARVFLVSVLCALVLVAHRKNFVEEISHLLDRRHVQTKTDQP